MNEDDLTIDQILENVEEKVRQGNPLLTPVESRVLHYYLLGVSQKIDELQKKDRFTNLEGREPALLRELIEIRQRLGGYDR